MVSLQPVFLQWNIGAHEGHVIWPLEMKESLLLEGTSMESSWLHLAIRINVNSDVLPGKWTGNWPGATHYQPITWAGVMKQKRPAGDIRAKDRLRPHVWAIIAHLCTRWFFSLCKRTFPPMDLTHFLLLLVSFGFIKSDESQLWMEAGCCSHKLISQTLNHPSTLTSALTPSAHPLSHVAGGVLSEMCVMFNGPYIKNKVMKLKIKKLFTEWRAEHVCSSAWDSDTIQTCQRDPLMSKTPEMKLRVITRWVAWLLSVQL